MTFLDTDTSRRLPRLPALDGLRAVALGAVLLFHSDYVWARGGHLGVSAFFTLSGFLIAANLLLEHDATGRIDLLAFWGRRARRLVPAMLVCLGLVVVYVAANRELSFEGLLGDAAASVTWLANWRFVAEGEAYANLFSDPSPFQHFWSLAIEEQFYLGLPIVAALVLGWRGRRRRWLLAILGIGVVAASTLAAAVLHHPNQSVLRAYYGTDARVAEPVLGVLLALAMIGPAGVRRFSLTGRRIADSAGVLALGGLALLACSLSTGDPRLYKGGFLLVSLLTASIVMAATQRGGVVDRMLSAPVLVGLGRISYGAYLFHWPVYLWMTEHRTGLAGSALLLARLATTFTLAAVSYIYVELPIRERRLPVRIGALAWANGTIGLLGALVLATAMPMTGQADRVSSGVADHVSQTAHRVVRDVPAESAAVAPAGPMTAARGAAPTPVPPAAGEAPPQVTPTSLPSPGPAPPAQSSIRVAVIGDSLAHSLGRGFRLWGDGTGTADVASYTLGGCPVSRGGSRRFPNGYLWEIREECSWWHQTYNLWFQELRDFDPDVIVVQDSFSELPDRKQEEWPTYMGPGEPVFDAWLVREYDTFIDTVAGGEAGVIVTNAVCADYGRHSPWNSLSDAQERVTALNQRVYPLVAADSVTADLHARLCPDGNFTEDVEGVENGRPDGFHLSDEAALALVEHWLGPLAVDVARSRDR